MFDKWFNGKSQFNTGILTEYSCCPKINFLSVVVSAAANRLMTVCLAVLVFSGVLAYSEPEQGVTLDDILKGVELETVYETSFDEPIRMIRESELVENGKFVRKPPANIDWVLEGPAEVTVKEGRLHIKNDPSGNCVLWNTREFPESFVAEWDFQHLHPQGLAILFFAAHAENGGSIFTPGLPRRGGNFGKYTRGKILSYHTSYTATDEQGLRRGETHLKKNAGDKNKDKGNLAAKGTGFIDGKTDKPYRIRLAKLGARIILEIDGQVSFDWTDDGQNRGAPYTGGQIGFRQMRHAIEASYGGLKIQRVKVRQPETNQETFPRNFDETKVPPYTLPDPLVALDGTKIKTTELWKHKRRPEILNMLETEMYGKAPGQIDRFETIVLSSEIDGDVLIKQVVLTLIKEDRHLDVNLLIFLPAMAKKPVPVILSMNFKGNHTVTDHPSVIVEYPRSVVTGHGAAKERTDAPGAYSSRWPIDDIISQGYGLITFARESVLVDAKEADFQHGVFSLFSKKREPHDWGIMAAWAWSMSRVIDYIERDQAFDKKRIAVIGSSRLGRASLWAGATDERIKVTIPNVAGKGSTSLLKRDFGISSKEVMLVKTQRYCDNFKTWAYKIDEMPFDAHLGISLIAPRPLYVSHAEEDTKVDFKGCFLALKAATPVYELFGKEGFVADEMPEVEKPIMSRVGMHIRKGKHDIFPYDWQQYLKFLEMYL